MKTFEELALKHHWIVPRVDSVAPEIDIFLDHHSMQSYRACEGYFDLAILQNYAPKGGHSWSLEFGIVVHSAMELLYESKMVSVAGTIDLMPQLFELWVKHDMERFKEHKTYKILGGFEGFAALIAQYAFFYNQETERLRPIAIEVVFGKAKEVPLGSFWVTEKRPVKVNCFLSGRIDFLMDSGSTIGPLDHKTTISFHVGNPMNTYEIQEGMTGYIYATNSVIKNMFPDLAKERALNTMWLNFIQVTPDSNPSKRFKRLPLFKTAYQLDEYRLRQVSTFKRIVELLVEDRTPTWSTDKCNNFFHSPCIFHPVHRQGSESSMLSVLNNDFVQLAAWNPERVEK